MGTLPEKVWRKNLMFVWISQFMAMVGFGCCMPFIPLLLRDRFGISDENTRGVYVALYQLGGMTTFCIATAVWGVLADRLGRKLMLLRASYGAAVLYPLLALAGNFQLLLLVRCISSFFSGTVNPAQTLMVSCAPSEKHGFVLGVLSTSIWSGHMAGYMLGGIVVEFFGYTAAFLCCSVIYAVSGILVHCFVKEEFTPPTPAQKAKNSLRPRDILTTGFILMLGMFLLLGVARRIDEPFIAMLVEVVNGREKAAFYVGIVSSLASVGGVISGFVTGNLCDRFDPAKILLPLLIFCAVTMFWQGLSGGIWELAAARFSTYFVAGGVQPAMQVMLTKITPQDLRGTSFGWAHSVNTAGGIFCALISGSVVYLTNVRGVMITAGVIFILMLPLYFFVFQAYKAQRISE